MGRELLFEIGVEEIPASFMLPALDAMGKMVKRELENQRIDHGEIITWGTPRRLVLRVLDMAESQRDKEERVMGPPVSVAFDADGNPTKAAEGFCKSQGVSLDEIERVTTPKGEYLSVVKREAGKGTLEILREFLPNLMAKIPFKKSMRWADYNFRFARPIHWILALFGEEVVEFSIEDISSGRVTYGHRFLAPQPITLESPEGYQERLREAYVVVDHDERKETIWKGVSQKAQEVGGVAMEDEDLLDEINFLVEYPVPLRGSFEEEYLSLPKEVLITPMKEHQRYFPIFNEKGELLPHFVVVSNMVTDDMDLIVEGNERVLRARLADAKFFFEEDKKVPLEKYFEKLKDVVFQEKLGTSYEKVMRFRELAKKIAQNVAPDKSDLVDRTALLAKADLESQMVYEFPELQGVMGREYARIQGEDPLVADGIFEHYLPRFAGDDIPSTVTGAIVGIADRLDTIVGCFGIGLIPTGSEDPYGIRRDVLGMLRTISEKGYRLSLVELIEESSRLLKDKMERPAEEVKNDVISFIRQRLYHQLVSQGYRQDLVDAVLSEAFDDVVETLKRVDALVEVSKDPQFEELMTTFKRVMNIIPEGFEESGIDPALLKEDAEKALFEEVERIAPEVEEAKANEDYSGALAKIVALKSKVDSFFDNVLVMDKDERVKKNRLSLLNRIAGLFKGIADLSKVVLPK